MTVNTYEVMVVVDVLGLSNKPMARFANTMELQYLPLPTQDKSQILILDVNGKAETFYPRQLSVRVWERGGLTLFVTSKPSRYYDKLESRFLADGMWTKWNVPSEGSEGE